MQKSIKLNNVHSINSELFQFKNPIRLLRFSNKNSIKIFPEIPTEIKKEEYGQQLKVKYLN
jgi:hypothetical protein